MALLAIHEQSARLRVRSGVLTVETDEGEAATVLRKIPLHDIDEVQLYGNVELTGAARSLLLRRGLDVVFLSRTGRYLGRLLSRESRIGERRACQYSCLADASYARTLAQAVVDGKLRCQRAFLLRLRRERKDAGLSGAIGALRELLRQLPDASSLDEVRGIEGYGAAMYFRGLGRSISHPEFSFESRTRRPPRDPFNACLSFGYTLLLTKVESAVRVVGLDPYLGALHAAGRGKPSAALDLMEEFRTPIDRLVMRLVQRRQLHPDDFEEPHLDEDLSEPWEEAEPAQDVRPAVYLAKTGREIFLRELGRLWRTRYLVDDARFPLHAIIVRQVQQLARCFETGDPAYQPFVAR